MLSDAYIKATCDGCGAEEEIELHYRYTSYSPSSGFYDDSDVERDLRKLDWFVGVGEDKHLCPKCYPNVEVEDD